jgi:hypothetical protein
LPWQEPLGPPSGPQQDPRRFSTPLTSQQFPITTFDLWASSALKRGGGAPSPMTLLTLGQRLKSTALPPGCAFGLLPALDPRSGPPGLLDGMPLERPRPLSLLQLQPFSLQPFSLQPTTTHDMTLEVCGLASVTLPSLVLLGSPVGPSSTVPSVATPSHTTSDKVGSPTVTFLTQPDGAPRQHAQPREFTRPSRMPSWTARMLLQPSTGSSKHGKYCQLHLNACHGQPFSYLGTIHRLGPSTLCQRTARRIDCGRAFVFTSSVLSGGCGAPGLK